MELAMGIAMLVAAVIAAVYALGLAINWSQRLRYPDDVKILNAFLRAVRQNPECFETNSGVGLETKGKGYRAANHSSLSYRGVHVNMGILDEARLNRAIGRHWRWQKHRDPKKARLAEEAQRT